MLAHKKLPQKPLTSLGSNVHNSVAISLPKSSGSKCPSTDEWIKKMWYIQIMEYYSAIKRNEIGSFVEIWMDLESVIQSEVSQKEQNKYILMHICGIQKNGTDEPICRAGIETQTQRMDMWTRGREGAGGMNWEIRFDINRVPCVKQIASGNLLYSTGSSAQCSVMAQRGGMEGQGGPRARGNMDTYS